MSTSRKPKFPTWLVCAAVLMPLIPFTAIALGTAFGYVSDPLPLCILAGLSSFVVAPVLGIEVTGFLAYLTNLWRQ